MKIGILYSGGKDSNLTLLKLFEKEEVKALVSIIPKRIKYLIANLKKICKKFYSKN